MTAPLSHAPLQNQILGVMADISQFLSDQKHLGNHGLSLSLESLHMIRSWGNPAWRNSGRKPGRFRCHGPADASVVLIDSLGNFYEGQGGELLVKMLGAINLSPDKVYICTPVPEYIFRKKIHPDQVKMIFAFGEEAAQMVTGTSAPLAHIQGKPVRFCNIPTMPTYHPEELIKDVSLKRPVWEAMKQMTGRTG